MVTRRDFLKAVGGAAALAAAGGMGLLSARAVRQGVFSVGRGPAYEAWRRWPERPRSELDLVRAAVLAASAHNTQPWAFRVSPQAIDLYAVMDRNMGALDPLHREMFLSLGCTLENLVLAARASGRSVSATLLPNAGDPTHAAHVALSAGEADISALYLAIPMRHTNRGRYATGRNVPDRVFRAIDAFADSPGVKVIWWTGASVMQTFADLTMRATEAIVADQQQSADDYAWWRGTRAEIQARKDGLSLDGAGLPPFIRAIAKLLPQTSEQYRSGWVRTTRDTHLPTAAAFGAIVVRDVTANAQRIQAGRLWQRIHLWATTEDLVLQPLNQTVERAEWESTAGLAPEIRSGLDRLVPEPGWDIVMPFRIGYPTLEGLESPRRPAEEVIMP